MDTDVVTAVAARELLARGTQLEGGALGELVAEALGAELLDQVAHAGGTTVLAISELTEDLGDRTADLHGLFGKDEDVEVACHPRPVGQPASDQEVEPDRAVGEPCGPHADVVDLGLGTVVPAARDGELELPREVGVLPVASEEVGDLAGDSRCIEDLVRVDARDGA